MEHKDTTVVVRNGGYCKGFRNDAMLQKGLAGRRLGKVSLVERYCMLVESVSIVDCVTNMCMCLFGWRI